MGDPGDRVEMKCQVDSNPTASYSWRVGGRQVGTGSTLSFLLTEATAGRYTCTAAVPGFSPVVAAARVQTRAPPRLTAPPGPQLGALGQPARLVCEAESVPAAKSFSWSFNGNLLRSPEYSIIETQHGARVRSTVIINNAEKAHFGDYVCNVENEIGSSAVSITLLEKGEPQYIIN